MSRQVVPLDRRPGQLPAPAMIAGLAPVVLIFVSLAAGHTWLFGNLTPGQAFLYVVPMVVLGASAAVRLGTRLLPGWVLLAYPVALLAGAALLEVTEALAPLTLAAGVAMLARSRRAPMPPPGPTVLATSPSPEASASARPAGASADGSAGGSAPRFLRSATGAPPVRLRLFPPPMLALLVGAGALSLMIGLWAGYAGTSEELRVEGGAAARWIALGITAVSTLFGLFLLHAAVRVRRDTLEIDAHGLRRHRGAVEWEMAWPEVRSVAVGLHTKIVPDGLTPTPRMLRERRTVQLLLEPVEPGFGGRAELASLLRADLPTPFTHAQTLPDTAPWASRVRLADTLGAALAAQVPDRYLVLEDRP